MRICGGRFLKKIFFCPFGGLFFISYYIHVYLCFIFYFSSLGGSVTVFTDILSCSEACGICKKDTTSIFWVMSYGLCPRCHLRKVRDGMPDCIDITCREAGGSVYQDTTVQFSRKSQ